MESSGAPGGHKEESSGVRMPAGIDFVGGEAVSAEHTMPLESIARVVPDCTDPDIPDCTRETLGDCMLELAAAVVTRAADRCRRHSRRSIAPEDARWAIDSLGGSDHGDEIVGAGALAMPALEHAENVADAGVQPQRHEQEAAEAVAERLARSDADAKAAIAADVRPQLQKQAKMTGTAVEQPQQQEQETVP